jgi:hypothetical protein
MRVERESERNIKRNGLPCEGVVRATKSATKRDHSRRSMSMGPPATAGNRTSPPAPATHGRYGYPPLTKSHFSAVKLGKERF